MMKYDDLNHFYFHSAAHTADGSASCVSGTGSFAARRLDAGSFAIVNAGSGGSGADGPDNGSSFEESPDFSGSGEVSPGSGSCFAAEPGFSGSGEVSPGSGSAPPGTLDGAHFSGAAPADRAEPDSPAAKPSAVTGNSPDNVVHAQNDEKTSSDQKHEPLDSVPVCCKLCSVAPGDIHYLSGEPLGNFIPGAFSDLSGKKKTDSIVLLEFENSFRLLCPIDGILYERSTITSGKVFAKVYDISGCFSETLLNAIRCCSSPSSHYLDQAEGYAVILEKTGLPQKDLTAWFNVSQSAVSNRMRLLSLSEVVRKEVRRSRLTERHCRALLNVDTEAMQLFVIRQIASAELSSRRIEQMAKQLSGKQVSVLGTDAYLSLIKASLFAPPVDYVRNRRAFLSSLTKIITNYRSSGAPIFVRTQERDDALDIVIRISKKTPPVL